MNITILDAQGAPLLLTTEEFTEYLDAVACSSHPDGFMWLPKLVGRTIARDELARVCETVATKNQVCILSQQASSGHRVLVTPIIESLDVDSRPEACKIMADLIIAAKEIRAKGLLITHFFRMSRYPAPHIQGIIDAIKAHMAKSFDPLVKIGFCVDREHIAKFNDHFMRELTPG